MFAGFPYGYGKGVVFAIFFFRGEGRFSDMFDKNYSLGTSDWVQLVKLENFPHLRRPLLGWTLNMTLTYHIRLCYCHNLEQCNF